ncbi:TonB-dependent receptor [Bergeriella denitrificans]|uniref:TonB-dependent receptor n=1 Tax=Bergeriella denitrificans TaxID=494 RepID=A0A378UFF5_BERDE|nr:TonB-dependent receptor [Bergeriella denitrificans]STZ76025.1 Uncharacterised protein [Bergeriella denitrificans]
MNVKIMVAALAAAGLPVGAAAEAVQQAVVSDVDVYGERRAAGTQHLDAADIRRLPTRNGTINELLKNNGAVQFSATANQSAQAGEITPEAVSFHGEPYYNNAFLIDGLSNNDIMNPGFSNGGHRSVESSFETAPTTLYIAPGAPEAFQVDASLLKTLNVYDSNVPAKYGNFTGGVVDAKLAEPDTQKAGGRIGFRTTRSSWTNYHLSEDQKEDEFEAALAEEDVQPDFTKQIYQAHLNLPLGERSAVLLGYNRTQSVIPEYHRYLGSGEWKDEKRLTETWLFKGTHRFSDGHKVNATLMYSPHENTYFRTNTPDSRYQSSGGGWRFALESQRVADWGDVDTTLAYTRQRNRIAYDGGADSYQWLGSAYDTDSSLGWCTQMGKNGCQRAYQGGFGTLESANHTWTLKQDYRLNPRQTGSVTHRFGFGFNADIARARSERPEASRYMYAYYNTRANGYPANITNVSQNCRDCIAGEQYQTHMTYFPAFRAKAKADSYSVYLNDELTWGRLRANVGANAAYNSFLGNFDVAPRFSFDYDTLGNGRFRLNGGLNRYYAGSMLAYALRQGIAPNEAYIRANDPQRGEGEWRFSRYMNNSQSWSVGGLDTPYSDEANLGFVYRFGNHVMNAKWVHRKSRDQFTPATDDDGNKIVRNDGRGNSNLYKLTLENAKPYQAGIWQLSYKAGARYHRYRKSYNGTYEEVLTPDIANMGANQAYYLRDGKRYDTLADMPPLTFNSPWSAYLELQTDIPKWHFKWTHALNFQTAYKNYVRYQVNQCQDSSQPQACGDWQGRVYDYRLKDYKQALTLDWRFLWAIPVRKNTLDISLDVLNVLDKKVSAGSSASNVGGAAGSNISAYQIGRQYWLGLAYRW